VQLDMKNMKKSRVGTVLNYTKKHPMHKTITAKKEKYLFEILDRKVSKNKVAMDLGLVSNGNINSLMFRVVEKLYQEGKVIFKK